MKHPALFRLPYPFTGIMVLGFLLLFCVPMVHARIIHRTPARGDGMGAITGKIMGGLKPVGQVKMTLIQHGKALDFTETDGDGFFEFHYVAEGYYEVKGEKQGFVTYTIVHVPVSAAHVTKVNFYMPEINNTHMPDDPIEETYQSLRRHMDHPDVSYPR